MQVMTLRCPHRDAWCWHQIPSHHTFAVIISHMVSLFDICCSDITCLRLAEWWIGRRVSHWLSCPYHSEISTNKTITLWSYPWSRPWPISHSPLQIWGGNLNILIAPCLLQCYQHHDADGDTASRLIITLTDSPFIWHESEEGRSSLSSRESHLSSCTAMVLCMLTTFSLCPHYENHAEEVVPASLNRLGPNMGSPIDDTSSLTFNLFQ